MARRLPYVTQPTVSALQSRPGQSSKSVLNRSSAPASMYAAGKTTGQKRRALKTLCKSRSQFAAMEACRSSIRLAGIIDLSLAPDITGRRASHRFKEMGSGAGSFRGVRRLAFLNDVARRPSWLRLRRRVGLCLDRTRRMAMPLPPVAQPEPGKLPRPSPAIGLT